MVNWEGKLNSVQLDITYSKELQQKMKTLDKLILKKHSNYTILVKYCVMAISRNCNSFLMVIERSLSQKGTIKVYENIPTQPWQVHKVFSLQYSEQNKIYKLTYWWNKRIMQLHCRPIFLDFPWNRHPVKWKSANLQIRLDILERLFRW